MISELDTAKPLDIDTVDRKDTVTVEERHIEDAGYAGGILPVIESVSKQYADRLLKEGQDGFIIVDKARMKVILYDGYGFPLKTYGMACAKNYGTKHKRADSRTPEGFFSVQGVYDSTDWLFTDDNGKTSKKKGQFGPRFIRLAIPTTSQIGIHGTCAPWSIGHRVSHGCIRLTNENILELVDLVHTGMPVIVLPGKKDRQVNREEGVDIVYFPTSPEYDITDKERKAAEESLKKREETVEEKADSVPENNDKIAVPETEHPTESAPEKEKGESTDTVPDSPLFH